ncbi:MAG: DbpA RNA binding domain-containing protein [Methylococcales bacterium]|nr:DbpA RNA binding domain-containing protein [Methylococcales bacterium]
MAQINSNEVELKHSIEALLKHQDLSLHQNLINRLSTELGINTLECAAALSLLNQPALYAIKADENKQVSVSSVLQPPTPGLPKQRVVRYRLDIGLKHQVQIEEIKMVLVDVSGVDKKRITRVDIRNHYTLIDLPEGMTADIFQLLFETEIKNKKLNIKRVKFHRRFQRRNNKNKLSKYS